MKCKTCSLVVTEGAECGSCRGLFHYACIGVLETNYRKMNAERKEKVRCNNCRASPESSQGSSAVLEEIKSFRAEFTSTMSKIEHISTSVDSLNAKWNEMETRFSNLEDRTVVLESRVSVVTKLQSELEVGKQTIHNLQNDLRVRDQQARINNVEISGIPMNKNENLVMILNSIYSKLGVQMEVNDVDSMNRVRRFVNKNPSRDCNESKSEGNSADTRSAGANAMEPRPPAIIVKFTRRMCKDKLLAAVRARRGLTTADIGLDGPARAIFISDHLTPENKLLLKNARQKKTELNYAFLWTRDCKILMRKSDTSKIIGINNDADLTKLK
ncbi:uncharacterized protein LOC134655220 [Cydia amplana]|uniref:uncharacterized protein LOC134655220 n=1 Tax=Cydia amplana TaxID=1869771 RepID=UPI002FE62C5E